MKKSSNDINVIREITKSADGIIYKYVLFSSRSDQVASFKMPLYSIEVSMVKDGEATRHVAKELFADAGKAISFFEKIAQNLTTPIDLPYVIEDRISV